MALSAIISAFTAGTRGEVARLNLVAAISRTEALEFGCPDQERPLPRPVAVVSANEVRGMKLAETVVLLAEDEATIRGLQLCCLFPAPRGSAGTRVNIGLQQKHKWRTLLALP
jgi:hypothetical protein